MRRLFCLILLLLLAACGSATDTGGGTSLGITPQSGLWQGSDLSFDLEGGKVGNITLAPHTCTGANGCTGTVSGPIDGAWSYANAFNATPSGGSITGNFIADTAVAGSLNIAATDGCCSVTVQWSAVWVGQDDATISDGPDAIASDTESVTDATTASDVNSATDVKTASDVKTGNDVKVTSDVQATKDTSGGGTDAISTVDTTSDSGDTGGSTDSALDWGGNSFGTIHPGPAKNAASPAALSCMASDQQSAIDLLNTTYRDAAGAPVVNGNCALAKASLAHAEFYVAHVAQYNASGLSVHEEDASYGAGFTGVNFWDRDTAAGFNATGTSSEVIAFENTPAAALEGWIETVYHRLPLLSPATQLIGYGQQVSGSTACNDIDSAGRDPLKSDPIIVWPWPGQHNVPGSWDGLEGPTPPSPPGGFPSGPVITAQFWQKTPISAHTLTNAAGTAIAHTWLDATTDTNLASLAPETVGLYANKPLSNGTYSVKLTLSTGDILAWRFTVGN